MIIENISKQFAIKTENVHTTNSWGFQGVIGKQYYFENGSSIVIGSFYTRHCGSYKTMTLFYPPNSGKFASETIPVITEYLKNNIKK